MSGVAKVERMRPFRFGLSVHDPVSRADFVDTARKAEDDGYSTLLTADHLGAISPMVAAGLAAEATDHIRVGPHTINNDFRHPAFLAQQAATVDLLTDGRLELGIGAGHAREEYAAAGWQFDRGATRVARLAESLGILRRLFSGETVTVAGEHYDVTDLALQPLPPQGADLPILVGGNGDRLLEVAACHADIVGLTGLTWTAGGVDFRYFNEDGLADRVALLREKAGDRFDRIELNMLIQRVMITDDPEAAVAGVAADALQAQRILESPFFAVGTREDVVDHFRYLRERHGISYFVTFAGRCAGFADVMAQLL